MCGIAGFSLTPKDHINATDLSANLLHAILPRGRHATGAAWMGADGKRVTIRKAGVPANVFTRVSSAMPPATARTALLHTRFATKGSPKVNANNHPLQTGYIVGTHNGVIHNDEQLTAEFNLPRKARVDSEAIFALMSSRPMGDIHDTLTWIDGDAALAWIDRRQHSTIHLAVLSGRPLAMGQTCQGGFIYASTMAALRTACLKTGIKLEWTQAMPDWSYLRVRNGVICDYEELPPLDEYDEPAYPGANYLPLFNDGEI